MIKGGYSALFYSHQAGKKQHLIGPQKRTRRNFLLIRRNFLLAYKKILNIAAEKVCYKVCNTHYKLCNMC